MYRLIIAAMIRKAARKFWAAFHSGKYDHHLLVVGAVETVALVLAAVLASSAVSGCEALTGQPSGEQDSTCSDCDTTVVNAKGNDAGADTKVAFQNPNPAGQHCGDCTKNSDCAEGLQCDTSANQNSMGEWQPLFICKTNEEVLIGYPICEAGCLELTGIPVCEADCTLTVACWRFGYCHFIKDAKECVAGSDADCAQSLKCKWSGLCHFKYGKCSPTVDADCAQSDDCRLYGECHQLSGIICAPASDADCAQSEFCHKYGECHFIEYAYTCAPASDADCAQSSHCHDYGKCHLKDDYCSKTSD